MLYVFFENGYPSRQWGVSYMHDEDIVCTCMSVSVRDIKTAIEAGASSFQEVQDATGAGTVCGACNDVLESVVEQLLRNR